MSIEMHQIHNLVRTYQQAMHPEPKPDKPATPAVDDQDHVSFSAQARDRQNQDTFESASHPEKPRRP